MLFFDDIKKGYAFFTAYIDIRIILEVYMAGTGFVDEIKDKCNIVDVIGRVVSLKRAGSNYKGICPFHKEKTPSFVVSEQKQIFTCFGCGATGNVISFVEKYYNLDFMDACYKLGEEYGIEIRRGSPRDRERIERLYETNRTAARYFFDNIRKPGSPGLAYMISRGISVDTIKKFGIGYADESWDGLLNHMKSRGIDEGILMSLGLVSKSGDRYYDKFRNRVMFPIINSRGKVIGFGGRILGDGMPKYLNSPESEVFLKKNNLYGINLTRSDMASKDQAILVEGYMDVVSLYQAGVTNVSASLGTALTDNQAKLISRYTKNVVLSYDSDQAGRNAALRGIDILHSQGLKPKVLHVTDGKDPDEFIKKHGKLAFDELVDKAAYYADYKIDSLVRRFDLEKTDGRIDFIKEAVKVLNTLGPAERDLYIGKLSELSGVSEGAIRLELSGRKDVPQTHGQRHDAEIKDTGLTPVEKNLIKILINDKSYFNEINDNCDAFKSITGKNIFDGIAALITEYDEINTDRLRDLLDETSLAALDDISENVIIGGKEKEVLDDCINRIRIQKLQNRYSQISSILDLTDDSEKIRELMMEQMEIQKELQRRRH